MNSNGWPQHGREQIAKLGRKDMNTSCFGAKGVSHLTLDYSQIQPEQQA